MRLSRHYFSAKTNAKASLDYCVDAVRKHDYEHYLCALLVPRGARDAAFAVRALNVETSQVSDQNFVCLLYHPDPSFLENYGITKCDY